MSRPHNGQTKCPHCDGKTVEHRHVMTKGLVSALTKFYEAGEGKIALKDVDLTHNQHANFQKLRYWDLVQMSETAGQWYLTTYGRMFVNGELQIPKALWTYRTVVVETEDPKVFIYEVTDDQAYMKKEDYAYA